MHQAVGRHRTRYHAAVFHALQEVVGGAIADATGPPDEGAGDAIGAAHGHELGLPVDHVLHGHHVADDGEGGDETDYGAAEGADDGGEDVLAAFAFAARSDDQADEEADGSTEHDGIHGISFRGLK